MPDLDLEITIIEDPYESFSLMSAGALDVTSSTAEYGP
ncbi:MAG TPA: ABC transporter, partial [Alcanivorax sp.]|nr:ABC transporter [Alcanivorax sp.]